MATTGTIAGDTPELLKPLLESFQEARCALQEEMAKDPVPEISCDQILSTTEWLKSVVNALNEHNEGFSRLTLSTLNDDMLHRNQALARESSRQLTLLFANESKQFSTTSLNQVMQFGMGTQSREIRDNLSNFSKFLEHFSQAKWLGDLIAPEFEEQKKLAIKILNDLQTETRLALPGCGKPTMCNRCGQMTTKTKGFCDGCKYCQHGYTEAQYANGCPYGCASQQPQQPQQQALQYQYCSYCDLDCLVVQSGICANCQMCLHCNYETGECGCSYVKDQYGCSNVKDANIISIQAKNASSVFEGLASGRSSLDKLEGLVKMSEALLGAFRQDVAARKTAEKDLENKMELLKDFAESVNEVPQVLRRFLLIRAGSISDIYELKAWVSQEEADQVHKMLEEFRDEVNEEKVLRRLSVKRAASEGSWSCVSAATPRYS